MNEGEFVGTLTMYFRGKDGRINSGYSEQWRDPCADVVTLSALVDCNQVLIEQSVASAYQLDDTDGTILVYVTVLSPRFWR